MPLSQMAPRQGAVRQLSPPHVKSCLACRYVDARCQSSPEGSSRGLGWAVCLGLCCVPGSRPVGSLAHNLSFLSPFLPEMARIYGSEQPLRDSPVGPGSLEGGDLARLEPTGP